VGGLTFYPHLSLLYADVGGEEREASASEAGPWPHGIISQKVFIKSFCKSQFPYKSVYLFLILVIIKNKLMDLCGN